jgi:hypothetical protein
MAGQSLSWEATERSTLTTTLSGNELGRDRGKLPKADFGSATIVGLDSFSLIMRNCNGRSLGLRLVPTASPCFPTTGHGQIVDYHR